MTGDQLYALLSDLIDWGLLALVLIVFIAAVAYVRGRRKG